MAGAQAPASYKQFTCETPDWGSTRAATEISLSVTKLDADGVAVLVPETTGRARKLFLEEDIFQLSDVTLNAFGRTVTIQGSGFSTTPGAYSCFVFEGAFPWLAASPTGTLHPTPCTLHPSPHTLHPTPYTLAPRP